MPRMEIILCLLLLVPCCSNNSEKKIYKTAIGEPTLLIYPDPKNPVYSSAIMNIPFKSKVEVIDNKVINRHVKIKYKDTIGYVYKEYLSEKDDIPFIDDIKYNLSIHEFDYDKKSVIKNFKNFIVNSESYKDRLFYYYTDDPQIFSLYGKNCDDMEVKIVAVIMNSKITTSKSHMICFELDANELVSSVSFLSVEVEDKIVIKEKLESLKIGSGSGDCNP